jgi:hypothetical protein
MPSSDLLRLTIANSAAIRRKPMRRCVSWVLILAAVASTAIVSARAADVVPAIARPVNPIIGVQAKARDCTPTNGPFGYYGNLWCKADGGRNDGASSRKRTKQEPAYKAAKSPIVTKKVDTTETKKAAESESPAEKAVENQNSSIARASPETDKSSEQTALEGETKPMSDPAPTNSAICKRYIPTVETVSVPCQKGETDAATCKQYLPTVKTVSVPCE